MGHLPRETVLAIFRHHQNPEGPNNAAKWQSGGGRRARLAAIPEVGGGRARLRPKSPPDMGTPGSASGSRSAMWASRVSSAARSWR